MNIFFRPKEHKHSWKHHRSFSEVCGIDKFLTEEVVMKTTLLFSGLMVLFLLFRLLINKNLTQFINFKKICLPSKPNFYLVCPKNYCTVQAHEISPEFNVPVARLVQAWDLMIKKQQRAVLVSSDPTIKQYIYMQKSLLFRFPDYITVQFIAFSEKKSTLAILSRSKYGWSDFGVNKKRVQKWLQALSREINFQVTL